ncbi:MAG: hypothetical protein R6W94_08300 [Spirochaetia bacterium]
MKYSKLMKERIRRTAILFKELGYEILDGELLEDTYTAGFESEDGFQGGVFIDRESKFLELAFTFSFSPELSTFIQRRMDEMLRICYEYGCYVSIEPSPAEVSFSLFSKVYYAGLNYFSLKETVRDFREAVDALHELLDVQAEVDRGASHGDT